MPISPRNKQFIIIAIIVAIVVVGIFLGYQQYQEVAAKNRDVKKALNELTKEEAELEDLKKLNETMRTMSVELNKVRQVLPTGISLPDLLANLEAIAVYSEITFDSVAVASGEQQLASVNVVGEEVSAPAGVKTLPLTVSVAGNYNNLKRYLDGIEKNLRLIDIDSIDVGESGIYTISMQAYYVD